MQECVVGKEYLSINITTEAEKTKEGDYFELALEVLKELSIKLSGGYYEPKSDRDANLSKSISDLVEIYEVT
jgi:hypothetical protein